MDKTLALEGLLQRWMQDIRAKRQLPGRYSRTQVHLLETVEYQLAATSHERWFDALPAEGHAECFYRDVVLPLQRELAWDDLDIRASLEAHIDGTRRLWMRVFWQEEIYSQRRPLHVLGSWGRALFDMDFDVLRRAGRGYFSPALSDDSEMYFAFVEEVETIPADQRVYASSGLQIGTPASGVELDHVRFSAILVDRFLPLAGQIDPVDPDNAGPEQRVRRKEQLRDALEGVALPVLDLFIDPDARRALGIELAFGDWCLLGLDSPPDDEGFLIYVTDPDDGERPTMTRGGLSLVAQAPEFWKNRLRDIFSLVHIPDADFDETERGGGNPVPNTPISPRLAEADEVDDEELQQAKQPPVAYRSAG